MDREHLRGISRCVRQMVPALKNRTYHLQEPHIRADRKNNTLVGFNFTARTHDFNATKSPVVLIGDSITESWRGTSYGTPKARAKGVPEVLANSALAPPEHSSLVLAISGDQTQHLLWRLEQGELPYALAQRKDAVFVVLIGTNNIGNGHLPLPTSKGVLAVGEWLLTHTRGFLLLVHLLPRADGFRVSPTSPPLSPVC